MSFRDLGSDKAVGLALMRHARSGSIRRIARGLYDFPKVHPELGQLAPDAEKVAQAIAERDHVADLQPIGAQAANALGLSDQIPAKVVFLTPGPDRRVRIGKRDIILKHRTPRKLQAAGRMSGMVIHALEYLGKDRVDDDVITALHRRLSAPQRRELVRDLVYAPAWMRAKLRPLLADEAEAS